MDIGYIRLSKAGPSLEEQEAALAAAGVDLNLGLSLYLDPQPKRGRQATFTERDEAIRALREGDRLVIHSAPRLGTTEAEMRAAASLVSAQGATIYDCTAAVEIRHHQDAGRLLLWAKDGAAQAMAERLGKARKRAPTPPPKPRALVGKKLAEAKALWEGRPANGLSVKTIAKQLEVSSRTVHREAKARGWKA